MQNVTIKKCIFCPTQYNYKNIFCQAKCNYKKVYILSYTI